MKTMTLSLLLGVSLFLGGCGTHQLKPMLGGGGPDGQFATLGFEHRDDRVTLDWNAATKKLPQPERFEK